MQLQGQAIDATGSLQAIAYLAVEKVVGFPVDTPAGRGPAANDGQVFHRHAGIFNRLQMATHLAQATQLLQDLGAFKNAERPVVAQSG